jgi:hypothetical protein
MIPVIGPLRSVVFMSSIPKKPRKRQHGKKKTNPRSLEQYRSQPAKKQNLQIRVAHALTSMRSEGLSLAQAARANGVDARTIKSYAGSALTKVSGGRYSVKKNDRVLRALVIPTERGLAEIATRSSRDATKIGKYSAAVQTFLETGDDSALRPFQGQSIIDAAGNRVPFLTDLDELERQGSAGVLSFESIYARVA